MCYSTCSLNPIEDEAVVAALLERAARSTDAEMQSPAVEIEPWPEDLLPALRRRPGLLTWRVCDHVDGGHVAGGSNDDDDDDDGPRLRWHRDYDAAVAAGMPHAARSMWPPSHGTEGVTPLHLERCSRLLPHDQDTGGFFIALLRKRAPLGEPAPPSARRERRAATSAAPSDAPARLVPMTHADADALGEMIGLGRRAARSRLLQPAVIDDSGHATPVWVAPAALDRGFAGVAGGVHVVSAGVELSAPY